MSLPHANTLGEDSGDMDSTQSALLDFFCFWAPIVLQLSPKSMFLQDSLNGLVPPYGIAAGRVVPNPYSTYVCLYIRCSSAALETFVSKKQAKVWGLVLFQMLCRVPGFGL